MDFSLMMIAVAVYANLQHSTISASSSHLHPLIYADKNVMNFVAAKIEKLPPFSRNARSLSSFDETISREEDIFNDNFQKSSKEFDQTRDVILPSKSKVEPNKNFEILIKNNSQSEKPNGVMKNDNTDKNSTKTEKGVQGRAVGDGKKDGTKLMSVTLKNSPANESTSNVHIDKIPLTKKFHKNEFSATVSARTEDIGVPGESETETTYKDFKSNGNIRRFKPVTSEEGNKDTEKLFYDESYSSPKSHSNVEPTYLDAEIAVSRIAVNEKPDNHKTQRNHIREKNTEQAKTSPIKTEMKATDKTELEKPRENYRSTGTRDQHKPITLAMEISVGPVAIGNGTSKKLPTKLQYSRVVQHELLPAAGGHSKKKSFSKSLDEKLGSKGHKGHTSKKGHNAHKKANKSKFGKGGFFEKDGEFSKGKKFYEDFHGHYKKAEKASKGFKKGFKKEHRKGHRDKTFSDKKHHKAFGFKKKFDDENAYKKHFSDRGLIDAGKSFGGGKSFKSFKF
ncbi:uncharacterized protein LOC108677587 [Hyalella azteca]|uniref:Uncharacterized protein LOC108677587 n=1 Tax=Hyalella azteca TaxID=294128 RepID=A0A8B7P5X6_HYAAZ|nr:uncharacterized protein LOC108677587 [Hyalella azteca]